MNSLEVTYLLTFCFSALGCKWWGVVLAPGVLSGPHRSVCPGGGGVYWPGSHTVFLSWAFCFSSFFIFS